MRPCHSHRRRDRDRPERPIPTGGGSMTGSGPPRPREPTCSSCFVGRTAAGKVPGPCKPVVLEWFDDVRPRRVRVHALRAGASGFLLKDAPEDQLVATIRVAANAAPCSPRPSSAASLRSSPGEPLVSRIRRSPQNSSSASTLRDARRSHPARGEAPEL